MISIQKDIVTIDSIVLAEYILEKYGPMSHLKLQKLLYYVQALHLAYFDAPLIEDGFEAWVHGPVSKTLFDKVKGHSKLYNEIAFEPEAGNLLPSQIIEKSLTSDQIQLIRDVLDEYSKLTGFELENMTHAELPWKEARIGIGSGDSSDKIISNETMRNFYKEQLYAEA